MNLLFLSFLSLFCLPIQVKPPVSFIEEFIEFKLKETNFTVNGNYYFVNNTAGAVSKEINYPFPVSISAIDSVHVFDLTLGKFLDTKRQANAIKFTLVLLPYDTVKLNIFYKQRGVHDTVHYILTTTKIWGEPLKKAEYTFETESSRKIKSFSYPPDKSTTTGDKQKYFWKKKDFLPEKDFLIILF